MIARSVRRSIGRSIGLALCAVVVIADGALAQPSAPFDDDTFRQRLQEALELTPEQTDSLRFLRADLEANLALLRDQVLTGELLAIEGRLRYKEVLDSYRVARHEILTGTQRDLLRRAQQLAREKLLSDGRPPERPPLHQLPEALDLTRDQIDRWKALLLRQREEVAQLREQGEILQPEDYRRLRESHRIAFESMLSAQQRMDLEQVRHQWRSARELADAMPDSLVSGDELPFPDEFGAGDTGSGAYGPDDEAPLSELPE